MHVSVAKIKPRVHNILYVGNLKVHVLELDVLGVEALRQEREHIHVLNHCITEREKWSISVCCWVNRNKYEELE